MYRMEIIQYNILGCIIQDTFNSKDIDFLKRKGLNSAITHKEMEGY